jgi:broad specificity phosphatase PhoE
MLEENDDLTLCLLRHGESTANRERIHASRKVDPPLTHAGRDQIRRQSEPLASLKFDACYTSPLVRAVQSAEILTKEIGLEFVQTKALLEVDVGALDGQPDYVLRNQTIYENVLESWENGLCPAAFPEGESLKDIELRLAGLLAETRRQERVLLLGHCLLFMCAIWLLAENHGPTMESGHMGRGHFSVLAGSDKGYRLHLFNQPPP